MKGLSLSVQWSCALLLALFVSSATAQIPPDLREKGVLYFEDNLPDKVTVTLHIATTVYMERDFQTALATLYPGQEIELVGMSPEGYLLKTNFRNNTLNGWIRPEDLPTGIDPGIFAQAKKNQARHDAVAAAIASKSVIRGMTTDEVKQSVGSPQQIATHTDASGSSLTWTYVTYQNETQSSYAVDPFGRPILQTYTVKVPIGQLVVNFNDGIVNSVSEQKTNSSSPGVVTD